MTKNHMTAAGQKPTSVTNLTPAIRELNIAIKRGGGILAFSRSLGVSHQVVYQWKKQGYVPTERALTIQHLYGMPYIDFVKPALATLLAAPSAADLI